MYFLKPNSFLDYELMDCGGYRKLERFGNIILDRPEINADWGSTLPKKEWERADWSFYEKGEKSGIWTSKNNAPNAWNVDYNFQNQTLSFLLKITSFKHIGIFPEQTLNWNFIQEQLTRIEGEKKVLNLFAYTATASVVAAKGGTKVTNVDSVKQVINWGKANAQLNHIDTIRWIHEDARRFVDRAIRRKEKYQGIILDPPPFGYGLKKQKWILNRDLMPLLEKLMLILDDNANFFILNTYSTKLDFASLDSFVEKIKTPPKNIEKTVLGLSPIEGHELQSGKLLRFWN